MAELENAMRLAAEEIRRLRRDNELLAAKAEVVNLFSAIIMPRGSQGMGIDAAWALEKEIEKLQMPEVAKAT